MLVSVCRDCGAWTVGRANEVARFVVKHSITSTEKLTCASVDSVISRFGLEYDMFEGEGVYRDMFERVYDDLMRESVDDYADLARKASDVYADLSRELRKFDNSNSKEYK